MQFDANTIAVLSVFALGLGVVAYLVVTSPR
jgi:hypothetical protein